MFVAIMAFFARISDPAVGGTYMTLLNTLTNLGGNWPATLALWAVDHLTWKRCQFDLKDVKSSNIRYFIFSFMFSCCLSVEKGRASNQSLKKPDKSGLNTC